MHRRHCHRSFGIIFIRGISTCGRGDHRSIKVVKALTSHDQNWSKGVMVPIALAIIRYDVPYRVVRAMPCRIWNVDICAHPNAVKLAANVSRKGT